MLKIARTEAVRARYDAFIARYGEDEDVVAYQWKLGSRHPAEDICDMYAEADLYGLGKGVFPKDAAPVNPAHPHCLCHYAPVYESELEGKKRSNNVEAGGNAWLKKQSLSVQEKILGVKGREEWKAGRAGWMEKARNFEILGVKESRLSEITPYSKRKKIEITDETIQKVKPFKYPGLSDTQNAIMQERQKELLKFAKDENNSNEVAFLLDEKLKIISTVKGTEQLIELPSSTAYSRWILHNHPRGGGFSFTDFRTLRENKELYGIVMITNAGRIQSLTKENNFDNISIRDELRRINNIFVDKGFPMNKELRDIKLTNLLERLFISLTGKGALKWKK